MNRFVSCIDDYSIVTPLLINLDHVVEVRHEQDKDVIVTDREDYYNVNLNGVYCRFEDAIVEV